MDWRDKAACLTADPELFFPVGNTGPAVDQIDKAKAVCARCSVTEQCLQYAETSPSRTPQKANRSPSARSAPRRAIAPRQPERTPTPVTRPVAGSQVGRQPISESPWAISSPPVRKVALPQRSMTSARGISPWACI